MIKPLNKIKQAIAQFSLKSLGVQLPYGGGFTYFGLEKLLGFYNYRRNSRNFEEYTWRGYPNPYVYSVTEKIARTTATLPTKLYNAEGEELDRVRIGLSNRVNLTAALELLASPSYMDPTNAQFMERVLLELLVNGNAIIYVERAGNTVTALRCAQTKEVQINHVYAAEYAPAESYVINGTQTIPAEDVLHIRFPNIVFNSLWGLSPLYAGQLIYDSSNQNFVAAASIFKNRGVSGILSPESPKQGVPIRPSEQEKMQADWQKRTAGADRYGKIHVTTMPMKYIPIGLPEKDIRLLEHNQQALRDICGLYNVDPSIMGDTAASTYNNKTEAEKAFYMQVALPLDKMVTHALSKWFIGDIFGVDDVYIKADKKQIPVLNRPDIEASQKIINEVNAGIITEEQARAILYPEL